MSSELNKKLLFLIKIIIKAAESGNGLHPTIELYDIMGDDGSGENPAWRIPDIVNTYPEIFSLYGITTDQENNILYNGDDVYIM